MPEDSCQFSDFEISAQIHTPPVWKFAPWENDTEENNDATQGSTCVQCSGQDVIVLSPPCEELLEQDFVEDEIDKSPRRVVDTSSWRNVIGPDEDKGPIDVAKKLLARFLVEKPGNDWNQSADPEEVEEAGVDATNAIEPCGSNEAPDDT